MIASVRHNFSGVFVLDEGQLRRINEIILRRLPDGASEGYEIQVTRADSFSFVTKSIDEVCAEENGPSIEVNRIRFMTADDSFSLNLDISKEHGVDLDIQGAERDPVFLIYSELKAYIDQGVMSRRWLGDNPYQWRIVGLLLVLLLAIVVMLLTATLSRDPQGAQEALRSTDALTKLNFIISRGQNSTSTATWVFGGIVLLMGATMLDLHGRLLNYFFPSNVFMLGRMVRWYESRMKLRSQLFWSVIVATILGVAISAYFAR